MSQTRVLVVDDERFFREAIRDVLDAEGFDLVSVGDGGSALEEAADATLGVCILDLQLPDLHGIEVFRRLRELRPDLRVIILSAHTDQEYVLEALRLGACDYLAKPIHEEELLLAVRRAAETFDLSVARAWLGEQVERLQQCLAGLGGAPTPEAIAAAAAEVLGADRASLLARDPAGSDLRVVAAVGAKAPLSEMEPIALGEGIAGWLAERSESALVDDLAADERFAAWARPERYRTGAFAVAPVESGDGLAGLLCVADPVAGPGFDEAAAPILRILADRAAAALAPGAEAAPERAAADRPAGDAPPEALRQVALAQRINEALTAEVEPGRILEAALRPVGELLAAAPVSLFLALPEGGTLQREAQWDGGVASDRPRLDASRGLTGAALDSGRPVASPDPAVDPRFEPEVDTPESGDVRPLLCGPLRFRGKSLGVYRVFPERAEDATPEVGEVLTACLSAAVRNVLLYRSLLETIEEVAVARREAQAGGAGS